MITDSVKDYRVTIKVRNARIISALAEKDEVVGSIVAAKIGISYGKLLDLSNLKLSPIKKDGSLIPEVVKLCDYLNKVPTDLFSPDQIFPLETNTAEVDMTAEEVEILMLPASGGVNPETLLASSQSKTALNELLDSLTPRETKILKLKYGMDCDEHTYESIAQMFDVSKERIRQIEAKALRKMRDPSRSDQLRVTDLDLPFPEKKEEKEKL